MILDLTEKELKDDLNNRGRGPTYLLAPRIIRRRKFPGESERTAKARWEREADLERDRDNEHRRVYTGQILPVFPED